MNANNAVLDGKPWDPINEPRLKLIDRRKRKNSRASDVTVEIRCRREDLVIEGIELKNQINRWPLRDGDANRRAAVDGYIRSQFASVGLDLNIGDVGEKFIEMVLARVFSNADG